MRQLKAGRSVRFDALAPQHYNVVTFPEYNARPDRKAAGRHAETQHPDYPETYWRNQRGPYAYRAVLHRSLKFVSAGAGL